MSRPIVTSVFHDEYDESKGRHPSGAGQEMSRMSDDERQAELQAGLAQRLHALQAEKGVGVDDRRLTWQELYDMFRSTGRVSKAAASAWADAIVTRGVRRR